MNDNSGEMAADGREKRLRSIYRRRLISLAIRTAAFAGVLVYLFTGVFGVAVIESNDMYPAIRSGDMVMYYRKADLMNADVVVYTAGDEPNIGRIEACGGSVIGTTSEGQITINGRFQPVQERMGIYSATFAGDGVRYPVTLKDGQYFILGDNRGSARDSRSCGCVESRDIAGKVFMIIRRRAI